MKGCLLQGWGGWGRLMLIQLVLESIPIYYLSLFKIPFLVASKIEKNLGDFFWEGYCESKGGHLINWNKVTESKQKGGLGIL